MSVGCGSWVVGCGSWVVVGVILLSDRTGVYLPLPCGDRKQKSVQSFVVKQRMWQKLELLTVNLFFITDNNETWPSWLFFHAFAEDALTLLCLV